MSDLSFEKPRVAVSRRSLKRLSIQRVLDAPQNRRQHLRTRRQERVFVQLSATLSDEHNRRTSRCASVDLSRGGLRLMVPEELRLGALLELWIRLASERCNYYLVGNVRWCVPADTGYEIGLGVTEAPATDGRIWRRLCFS